LPSGKVGEDARHHPPVVQTYRPTHNEKKCTIASSVTVRRK